MRLEHEIRKVMENKQLDEKVQLSPQRQAELEKEYDRVLDDFDKYLGTPFEEKIIDAILAPFKALMKKKKAQK